MSVDSAINKVTEALEILKQFQRVSAYTMAEMKEARSLLLQAVKEDIDELAFGHLPRERRY